jgi:nucleoside-diphosphate-sugar epimerase
MPTPGVEFTAEENDYNEAAVEAAWKLEPYDPSRAFVVYMASKVQSERAVWKWVEDNKLDFVVNTGLRRAGTYQSHC